MGRAEEADHWRRVLGEFPELALGGEGQLLVVPGMALPVSRWNWKSQDASQQRIGPTAQDFHAAFGLGGDDDRHITGSDADGVALAAIQGLYEIVQGLEAENASLQQRLDDLDARVTALEAGAGTSAASAGSDFPGLSPWWLALLGGLVVVGLVLAQRRLAGGRP